MHEQPLLGSVTIEAQLVREDVQAAPVHAIRDRPWITEELADVEVIVAEQSFGVDHQPVGALGAQNVVVVHVAVQDTRLLRGHDEVMPQLIRAFERCDRKTIDTGEQGSAVAVEGRAPALERHQPVLFQRRPAPQLQQ